jgi:hypothetical protein
MLEKSVLVFIKFVACGRFTVGVLDSHLLRGKFMNLDLSEKEAAVCKVTSPSPYR